MTTAGAAGATAVLPAGRTLVMGVLNTTPDSFSDGGAHHVEGDPGPAVEHGLALVAAGADVVDVGGESTRPGAARVGPDVEAARVLPVVAALAARGVVVSVDTTRAAVARAAVEAGACLVNDVSGGLADPSMAATVADLMEQAPGVLYVAMHWRGPSDVMDSLATYDDGGVVAVVERALRGRRDALADAGVDPARVVLDPGLGFAKRGEHDLALLAALPRLVALGPLLVGASRKRFLGAAVAGPGAPPRPAAERDDATAAVSALAAAAGAWGVRVHAPRASADAVRVVAAVRGGARGRQRGRSDGVSAASAPLPARGARSTSSVPPRVLQAPRAGGAPLDVVELVGLRARGRHGVLAAERELGQVFTVDLVMHLDTRPAAASDDLADAVDYGAVAEAVHAVVTGEPVDLLETLAARVADAVLADHRVRAVDVAVHKPSAPVTVAFDDVVVRVARTSPWQRAVLSLGSNVGDSAATLASAVRALGAAPGVRALATSPACRTAPVGGVEQDDYLNAVLVVATTLAPGELLALAHRVEDEHGRDRDREVRWGPRTLDVDVVTMVVDAGAVRGRAPTHDGTATRGAPTSTPSPVLPHPRAHERAFVLVPWAAVAPDDELPGHGRVADLVAALAPDELAGVRPADAEAALAPDELAGVRPAGEVAR